METYLTQFTNYLLTQSWQIAALVVVIAAATFALRNKSAHVRYLLWLIVLAKCLTPPLLEIPIAVLPERTPAAVITIPMPTITKAPPETPMTVKPAPIITPEVSYRPQLNTRQWLAIVWLIGAVAFACIAAVKAWRTVRWLHRDRRPLPADVQTGVNSLLSSLNLRRLPKMWLIGGIGQPFVWGALRGDIYLPAAFVRIPDDEHRRHVLCHELSHVMRFDVAVNLIQTIAQAILWFHPFVWWANKKIRAEREKCCDEMAIARLNACAKDYGKAIVETLVTEYKSTRQVPSLAIAGPAKNIEERIKTMLKPGKKFYKRPSLTTAIAVILIAMITVPTALVLTARAAEKTETKSNAKPTKSLEQAASEGDLEQVRLHISNGADLNSKDQRGRTALHRAANHGHVEVARLLIENGADVNIGDNQGRTPLQYAAIAGQTEVVRLLLEKGANPNARNRNGGTPFHTAASSADINIVKLLIDKGADVTVKNNDGKTPIYSAMMSANENRREIVKSIVATGKVPSTIYLTAYMGDLAKVKTFIREGAKVNKKEDDGMTALHYAAAGGQKEVAQWLLAQGADVNLKAKDGMTPLHTAMYYSDDVETIKLLISNGAEVNNPASVEDDSGMSVLGLRLMRCVMQSLSRNDDEMTAKTKLLWNSDVTKVLLSNGARFGNGDKKWLSIVQKMDIPEIKKLAPTNNNEEPIQPTKSLHQAAAEGDLEQVKRLIAEGADINSRGEREFTPLHVTGWGKGPGTVAVAEMLIQKGADVNARAKWRETPLTEATSFGHIALAKLLVDKGTDPDAACEQGCTPLHHAVNRQDMPELVELLIANGANIQARDNTGGTPLHWAARFGREKATELLVAKGADVNAKDRSGGTPLMEAAANGHVALAKLLIEKGANVNARDKNDQTALHIAAWRIRKRDIVDLLIAEGADVNAKDKDGDTPADFAFYGPVPYSNKIVKLLVQKGAGISKLEGVYLAAYLGNLSQVKDYLRQGKDVNTRNEDGKTLLHIAALVGESEVLEFLIANGANLNMKDNAGSTPLDYAQCHQHFSMAKLLVANGAIGTVPKGWARRGGRPEDYAMTVDRSDCHSGQACAHIRFTGDVTLGFGTLLQAFRADDYRGKRVKMSAWMKTKEAKRAQLWMRLDGVRKTLGFDNMGDRPVRGTTGWNRYEITLEVPQNTMGVCFGALVSGSGEAWVDDFNFSVVGEYIPDANMTTQEQVDVERIEGKRNPQVYPQQPVNLDFEDLGQ